MLQGTLYVPVRSTSKGTCSSTVVKLNNPLYKDVEINSDWVIDAAEDDSELWEALSLEHCPPPPLPTTTSSQSMNGGYT